MFPNPHDALPLPSYPNLEQYKKRAKDLVKAAGAREDSLRMWTLQWLKDLARAAGLESTDEFQVGVDAWIPSFEECVRSQSSTGKLPLSKAQFVLARAHGFESWPKFAKHVEAMSRAQSSEAAFEEAADAIVAGDLDRVRELLRGSADLVKRRSARQHRATLLHYVAANGVESYRQKTPKNAVEIARLVLDSGADVNAEADVYGGGATTLELVATSVHPERAEVQEDLMQLLIDRGATEVAAARDGRNVVSACLGNGRPRAAEFLAARGFHINLEAAAGLGRLDVMAGFFDQDGKLRDPATKEQMQCGLAWACEYGKSDVVGFLLERGASLDVRTSGLTPLHWAVLGGDVETVRLLIARGADLENKNAYGGSALGQALWSWANADGDLRYLPVIELLLGAGAHVSASAAEWARKQRVSDEGKVRITELMGRPM